MIFKNKLGLISAIVIGFVLVLAVGGGTGYYYLKKDRTQEAFLMNYEGNVEILRGEQTLNANEDMKLKEGDSIKTNSGKATVVLHDSVLVSLKSNTQVELTSLLEENIKVEQTSGTVWSKFLNVVGVGSYEVKTPNAVAIVRGTEFKTEVENGETKCLTSEGTVEFGDGTSTLSVSKGEKCVKNETVITKLELTDEDKKEILERLKETLHNIKELRKIEIEKHEFVVNRLKKQYDLTEEDIDEYLDQIDRGEIDEREHLDKLPVDVPAVPKILAWNDEIKELMKEIEELETELNEG